MKIVITGCHGQLGNALLELLVNGENSLGNIDSCYKNAEIFPVDIENLDITDSNAVDKYISDIEPQLIINCAAMTNVDGCEDNLEAAEAVNAKGPANLAAAAEKYGAKLVHISTDYVFHGDAAVPYVETDKCDPVTAYGITKYHGELAVLAGCSRSYIIRTSWLYGYIGKNFVKTIRKIGAEKGALTVVDDQRGNPTNADDLAYHILLVACTDNYGLYHCTGSGECSWYDFAKKIIELSDIKCTVFPCKTAESGRKARRPAYSSLDNKHLRDTVGDHMRYWEDALTEYIYRLDKTEQSV